MSYTLSNSYKFAAKSQSVQPDWLMRLHYYDGADSTNYIGISSKDRIVQSEQYYGIVTNWSSVVKTIDVAQSTAQLASFTIECVNKWKEGTFSEELFAQGTNYFVNNKCLLYMGDTDETAIANWILLGEYRLVNVGHDAQTVTLEFEERVPWDGLTLPHEKQGAYYFPVVYGNYTAGTAEFYADTVAWPAPVKRIMGEDIVCHVNTEASGASTLYYYDKVIEKYLPLDTAGTAADSGSSRPDSDGKVVTGPADLRRDYDFYLLEEGGSNEWQESGGTFEAVLSDASDGTYCADVVTLSGPGGTSRTYFEGEFPQIEGELEDLQVFVRYAYRADDQGMSGDTFTLDIYDVTYNTSATPDEGDATSVVIQSTVTTESPSSGAAYSAAAEVTYDLHTANTYEANDNQPSKIRICLKLTRTGSNGDFVGGVRLYRLYVLPIVRMTDSNGELEKSALWYMDTLKYLYAVTDGPVNAWDSSAITECQQMHREILQTHVGLATGDIDTTAWGNLDTAKNGWTARLWELTPVPIKEILERLQFEGGFIAFWSQQKVKYIWVANDPSGDSVGTLTEDDYKDMSFSLTPWDEIVTTREYRNERDPATDESLTSVAWPASDLRAEYNVGTKENIEEVDLRYNVDSVSGGTNPNDHIGRYYDNITNEPKVIVSCRVMNPLYFNLEVGDVIQINDSKISAFGKTMANVYFMITEERRQPQQLEITAREIYDSS